MYATLAFNGQEELLFLPEEETAINKAVRRLGAGTLSDCDITLERCNAGSAATLYESVYQSEGFLQMNSVMNSFDRLSPSERAFLSQLLEYSGFSSAENIAILSEHLDDLYLIPETTPSDVAEYVLDEGTEYECRSYDLHRSQYGTQCHEEIKLKGEMYTMKKIVSLLLSVLMIVGIAIPVYAEDDPAVIASGTVKGSVTWKVTEDGVLTIGGTGPMENYTAALKISSLHYTKAPYYEYKDQITSLVIEEGVTSIGYTVIKFCWVDRQAHHPVGGAHFCGVDG